MLNFDWTISVGNILTAGLVIGGWFYAFFKLQGDVRIVKHDMATLKLRQNGMNDSVDKLTDILTRVAVQDERFASQEHRIQVCEQDVRDLQNGVGFRTEKLTGEYTRHGRINK